MKIAFIGYGNMSSALVNGILASDKIILSDDLYIFHNKNKDEYNLERCTFIKSGEKCSNSFDIVFLCIKPNDLESAISENFDIFSDNQIIISIAAGVEIKSIKNAFLK